MGTPFRSAHRVVRAIILIFLFGACGRSSGCSGCDQEGAPFPDKDRVHSAAQIRISASGMNFLEENLEPLLGDALPEEGLNFCLDGDAGNIIGLIEWGYCQDEMCPNGNPGCNITLDIGGIDLEPVEPDVLRATVTFADLNTRFDIAAEPIIDCAVAISAPGFPVSIDLLLSTPDPTRDLTFTLQNPSFRLADIDIQLEAGDGFLSVLCVAVDAVINFPVIGDLLLDLIQGLVDTQIAGILNGFVEGFTCRTCEINGDCPQEGGGQCVDGICRLEDACIPAPLGIEGTLDVGGLLAGISPGLIAKLNYLATPGSYVQVENQGLSVGMIAGMISERDRCVPARPQPPIDPEPLRADSLRGNATPSGNPFEVGVGISDLIVEHAMWAAFNSGALCLSISSDQVEQLNAQTLGIALPNLQRLTRGPAPLAITLSPQEVPVITIGANTVMPDPDEPDQWVLDDPLLTIEMPALWMDFHAFMEDRWTRIFSLKVDLTLPLGIAFSPENGLIPILGDLSGALQNVEVANGEIMFDDPDRLAMLLPILAGPLLSLATDSLVDPIALPDLLGYQLNLQEGSVLGIENNTMIGLFADLERNPDINEGMGIGFSVETQIEVIEVHIPPTADFEVTTYDTWKRPWVRLAVEGWDGTLDDAAMEYQWRVKGGSWSLFSPAEDLLIRHPLFLLQGRHQIEVRGRRADEYRTLDPTPATVEVIIDSIAPKLVLHDDGGWIQVEASDMISPSDALRIAYQHDNGPWVAIDGLEVPVDDAFHVTVRVTDEAGNSTTEAFAVQASPLIGRPPPGQEISGGCGGCDASQTGSGGASWALGLIGLLMLRKRRISMILLFILGSIGCSDNAPPRSQQEDGGPRVTPDVGVTSCTTDPKICGEMTCETGEPAFCNDFGTCECAPFCGGECPEDQFCCQARNACEVPDEPCIDATCEAGFEVQIADPGQPDPVSCELVGMQCDCVELPPLETGEIGRFSDLAMIEDTPWISAYSDDYGDLVVGSWSAVSGFKWAWVDGVPEGMPTAGPSGPRGGIADEGPDVGRSTSLAAGPDGHLHVSYYDIDNQALKYALGTPDGDEMTWETHTLDVTGNAGEWSAISVDARGVPGVAYRVGSTQFDGGFASEVRYLLAKNAAPTGDADWNPPFTLQTRMLEAEDPETGTYPEGTGLFVTQTLGVDGLPVVAWYDRSLGAMWWTHFAEAGFGEPQMLAGWGHPERDGDMGTNVDLAIDTDGNAHLCYQNGLTDTLWYLAPELGFDEMVDDGIRVQSDGREHALHVVGEDCNIRIDPNGNPLIVYQDATGHDLILARRDNVGNWISTALRGTEIQYRGAFGFYARARLTADSIWISHFVLDHASDPVSRFLELLQRPL